MIHRLTALLEGRRNGKKGDLAKERKDLPSRAETDASGFQIMHWKGAEIYHVFTNHHTLQDFVKQPSLIEDKLGGVIRLPLLISLFTIEQGLHIQL
jgi:hypothetical protein